jgi:AmmeMemoRadiSam system protein B
MARMTLNPDTRPAAVAGLFYPRDPQALEQTVQAMLADAAHQTVPSGPIKAVIAPHAGYIYSGPVAASAYAPLARQRTVVRRVVVLGPVHRVPVRGLALPADSMFETPLGKVAVDRLTVARLRSLPQVRVSRAAHALEHSLEVQLPFLQQVLADFTLVPLAVGDAAPEEVAEVLDMLWGGPETLIVVSSDLSHYHSYDEARHRDRDTCETIRTLVADVDHDQACGGTPINGLMEIARRRRLAPQLLDLRNSGDTAGDRARVVGYAAFAFTEAGGHGH